MRRVAATDRPAAVVVLLDVGAVALFVAIGRSVHGHGLSPAGFASTAWPFAVGLAVGWAVARRLGPRVASTAAGAIVAIATVAVGMALRVLAGQGTAVAFVLVALGFLGAIMVGSRLTWVVASRRGRRPSPN